MSKSEILRVLKLLSAIEGWGMSVKEQMPTYLVERLDEAVDDLTKKVLEL